MKITFKNNINYIIVADLYSFGAKSPIIIFSHGFKSGRHSPRNTFIANALREEKISVLLLDFTGHGESEGTLEESTTERQTRDLIDALNMLELKGFTRFGLSGSSFGGASALMCTARDNRVKALVLRYSTMNACFSFKRPCYELADKISVPTLCIVGENDHPILEENKKFLDMLQAPKDLVTILGAGHAFDEPDQLQQAVDVTVSWFKKYL